MSEHEGDSFAIISILSFLMIEIETNTIVTELWRLGFIITINT